MFGERVDFTERMMDFSSVKRNAISNNIANYSTPEYKATKVEFESHLDQAKMMPLKTSSERHMSTEIGKMGRIHEYQDLTSKSRTDGNNVDMTVEMLEMIKNNGTHTRAVTSMNHHFSLLKSAMTTR